MSSTYKRTFISTSKVFQLSGLTKHDVSSEQIRNAIQSKLGALVFFFQPTPGDIFFIPKDTSSNAVRPGMEIQVTKNCKLKTSFSANLFGTSRSNQDDRSLFIENSDTTHDNIQQVIAALENVILPTTIDVEPYSVSEAQTMVEFAKAEDASIFHMAWQALVPNLRIEFATK